MPLDPEFLELLVCPACKRELSQPAEDRLVCAVCRRAYPVRDEIPVLLLDEAMPLEPADAPASAPTPPPPAGGK